MNTVIRRPQNAALAVFSISGLLLSGCQWTAGRPSVATEAVVVSGQEAGTPTRPSIGRPATYLVQPGDRLNVFVFDNPDLTQTVVVGPDGKVNFPLVGSVRAEGQTLSAIDSILTARLKENILQPEVTVTLTDVSAARIYVTGEVVSPGVFDVPGPVSVVQALSMAGGFTAFARRNAIVVYNPARTKDARRVFNYDAFLANPAAYDIALRPGDTVIVQ